MTDPVPNKPSFFEEIKGLAPTKRTLSLLEEFKAFALKGNVIDLAIGVVIGTAFGKIVDSLVKNLLMPLVSLLIPGQDSYQTWKLTVHGTDIPFGLFLGDVVNFLIISAAIFFFVVKLLGWIMRYRQQEQAKPPPPTEQELLTEIRDLLRQNLTGPADRASSVPGLQRPPETHG
jgi:large conductance mechanosensitive channel